MPTPKSVFMRRLKELRLLNGLTQASLAEQTQLSATTINRYENGMREPDLDTLGLIADFFGVDFNSLLCDHQKLCLHNENDLVILHKFHSLDNRGKTAILNMLEYEYSSISAK